MSHIYKIKILSAADKTLKKIPFETREKIVNAISNLSINPKSNNSKKLKNSKFYRIRINDYRVIYQIQNDQFVILIIRIGHRKDIYRRKL